MPADDAVAHHAIQAPVPFVVTHLCSVCAGKGAASDGHAAEQVQAMKDGVARAKAAGHEPIDD